MKKMIIYIIIGLVIISVLGGGYFWYNQQMKPEAKIIEYRDFSCPGMTGFTFKYPVFEGWKPSNPKSTGQSECTIQLSSEALLSNNIDTEVSPQIKIKQIHYRGIRGQIHPPVYLKEINKDNILFEKTDAGYDFWTGDSIVSIELWSAGGYGFSLEEFFETVIDSFKLTE